MSMLRGRAVPWFTRTGLRTVKGSLILMLLVVCLLIDCSRGLSSEGARPPAIVGGWVVYWDCARGLSELERWGRLFDRASFFAYELDEAGQPLEAPEMAQWLPAFFRITRAHGIEPRVTVVNDVRQESGSVSLKDAGALRSILADDSKRRDHAQKLAEKANADGFAGIDLDYEALDAGDQEMMSAFVQVLNEECAVRGLKLDIVVEPRRGPQLDSVSASRTVMAYNLNGPHSKAGPRSTPEFIRSLAARTLGISGGERAIALATGGFAWVPDGKVQAMDWRASARLKPEAVLFSRDHTAEVPFMRLGDGTEVWFEDAESMRAKWNAAGEAGFNTLMIWRLGGNDDTLFGWLSELCSKERQK